MEKLLTIDEVADLLGLSVPGIYGLSHKHLIPCVRVSARCLRFKAAEIAAWLESKSSPVTQTQPQPRTARPGKRSPGRPRKNSVASNYINTIVESAKREVNA